MKNKHIKKYCKHHESSSHNTSECRYLKYRVMKIKKMKDKKFYTLRESKVEPNIFYVKILINDKKLDRIIDTDSAENYHKYSIIKEIDINKNELIANKQVEVANGPK
ncbi:hypothetical protein DMUE_2437 [Dictyocoela muelleri]|nr:hypothetical protein DMUE_2437 [Dictyocoela muelleri]